MTRVAFALFLVAVVAVSVLALTGEPGRASMEWMGWRVEMTAAAAALLTLFSALMFTLLWRGVIWIVEAPRRAARARAEAKRKQAIEALSRGFLAVAAGDGSEARRLAQKSSELAEDAPGLVRVLAAQAAEAAGDRGAAKSAYNAMLGFPEMRLAGLRGLMLAAQAEGDRQTAIRHAETAYGLARTARWAWRALLEARLEAGDWAAALQLVQGALERKIVSPVVAERSRAALLAASAASLVNADDPKTRAQALDFATQSVKLKPDFAPGVVMAARLLAEDGKTAKAGGLIETAWKAEPHPALWLAYRDLKTNETPKARAQRLAALAAMKPEARESRLLRVESALIGGDPVAARAAARLLDDEAPTARFAGLMARVAAANGDADEARAWIARGVAAPQEPDWSDLDPEGLAFAYQRDDWARLAVSYAETGQLIHPRHERRERTMNDLPELPSAYAESTPFIRAAETGGALMPIPDDPGVYDAPLVTDPPEGGPAPRRNSGARRRLPSGSRAAK
ncbi:heme biosynthesis protein HemY [Caulobacter vibrioides]|uniref:heme biosynthesis protein HemY n=1 Tax=Caulobacter vibrioides TaxID=155892 RepID=UPI000BB45A9C|nr:heme biosynthesis HemY N-terminal domain-containing protein [Caulobacter vibrioides]ATC23092.1 heme biosynthesis protein HemY [Caulobacter vibrioides]AZH11305.1 heme biosynthesis protein HemY [Caulobacter vibrioides]PLR13235.1 heme biosynthesis protein HemY [Caulobacter vibrioides]